MYISTKMVLPTFVEIYIIGNHQYMQPREIMTMLFQPDCCQLAGYRLTLWVRKKNTEALIIIE